MGQSSAVHGGFSRRAKSSNSLRASKFAELCLWAIGLAALGYCAYIWAEAWIAQREGNRELDRSLSIPPNPSSAAPQAPQPGALLGRVELPRLDVAAVVFEGTDDDVLDRGVGHLRGSALPGNGGNVVLAAHRDTFFRGLRKVREGDSITLSTPAGPRHYQVESTQVVSPYATEVAAPTPEPILTLITCYPFEFLGHAPQRFIVRAREIPRHDVEQRPNSEPSPVYPRDVVEQRDMIKQQVQVSTKVSARAPPPTPAARRRPVAYRRPPVIPVAAASPDPYTARLHEDTTADPPPAASAPPARRKLGWMNPTHALKKLAHRH